MAYTIRAANAGNVTLLNPGTYTVKESVQLSWSLTGKKRSSLDQARQQLLQQLLAAELNASAFGSAPKGGAARINSWEAAYCGTNLSAIKNAQSAAASFKTKGDSSTITPETSANSKCARSIADLNFWDILP